MPAKTRTTMPNRRQPSPGAADERLDTRERLLKAAFELFARKGFDSVSIKEIGQLADTNPALIYYHFADKNNLFHQSLATAVEAVEKKFAALRAEHNDPRDLISDWFQTQREERKSISRLVKVMVDYSMAETRIDEVDLLIARFYRFEIRFLADTITAGMQSGKFKPVNAERIANIISIHLDGVMTRSAIQPQRDMAADLDDIEWLLMNQLGITETSDKS